ncbi:hypothetical protein ACVWY6_003347 [Williamsia sp. R60]
MSPTRSLLPTTASLQKLKVDTTYLGSKRLVLQCSVTNADVVRQQVPSISNCRASDLHLTVFHVGKSLDLYREISATTGVSLWTYEAAIVRYLHESIARSLPSYSGRAVAITSLLSNGRSYEVITIEPEPSLVELRNSCRVRFLAFLGECGVDKPEAYMETSQVVGQHSPHWLPHITFDAQPLARSPDMPESSREAAAVDWPIDFGALHVRRSNSPR